MSNLVTTDTGTILYMHPRWERPDDYMRALSNVMSGARAWNSGRGAALDIKNRSGQGNTPIRLLVLGSHSDLGINLGTRDEWHLNFLNSLQGKLI